jgi:hypothetical protein
MEVGLTAAEDMATPVVPVLVHPPGGKRSTAIARDTALPFPLNTVFPFSFDICTLEGRPGVVKHEQAPTRHELASSIMATQRSIFETTVFIGHSMIH